MFFCLVKSNPIPECNLIQDLVVVVVNVVVIELFGVVRKGPTCMTAINGALLIRARKVITRPLLVNRIWGKRVNPCSP